DRLVLELRANHVVNKRGDPLLEHGEHALLLLADRGGKPRCLGVPRATSEMLERPIGRGLERLRGALVLRVLQQLLLGAGATEKIKRTLAEGEGLANQALNDAD